MELTVGIDIWDSERKTDSPTRKDVLQTYEGLPANGVHRSIIPLSDASALGDNAIVSGARSIATGPGSLTDDDRGTSLGQGSSVQVKDSTVVGQGVRVRRYGGTVVGRGSATDGYNGIAIGRKNKIAHNDVILIGNTLVSTVDDEIIISTANTELRVATGVLTINGVPVGGAVPNFAETGSATISTVTNNVWSAWTELIAATAQDTVAVIVSINSGTFTAGNGRFDFQLAIGAAGVETELIDDHIFSVDTVLPDSGNSDNTQFSYTIPSGARISARARYVRITGTISNLPIITITALGVV